MTLGSLEELDRYLEKFCRERTLKKERCYRLRLLLEELATNAFKYSDAKRFTVRIEGNDPMVIRFEYTGEAFDFRIEAPHPGPPEVMKEGGLGLFLVREMSRYMRYRHQDGKNVYELTL